MLMCVCVKVQICGCAPTKATATSARAKERRAPPMMMPAPRFDACLKRGLALSLPKAPAAVPPR